MVPRSRQEAPGAARGRQEAPGAARGQQGAPGAARSRQGPPGSRQGPPVGSRGHQGPGAREPKMHLDKRFASMRYVACRWLDSPRRATLRLGTFIHIDALRCVLVS